jgi:N-acetylglutamate synthase-like GNAT family acetyltransferase
MEEMKDGLLYTDEKTAMQSLYELLDEHKLVNGRSEFLLAESVKNSYAISVFDRHVLVGFARVVSDYGSLSIIRDVVIASEYRHRGIAQNLFAMFIDHPVLKKTNIMLWTKTGHSFYTEAGFKAINRKLYVKIPYLV